MEDAVDIIAVLVPIALLALAFATGKVLERRHYQSIAERERKLVAVPAVTCETLDDERPVQQVELAVGSVVVSADYFKRFLMGFRKIVGGEIRSYSSVIDRARREAIVRMKESCPRAHMFLNCRLETSSISGGSGRGIGFVEIVAYSTAVTFKA
ncbi:MAG: heavy metal-binding domain-containing protein [Planctomycetes bacterium]|nr:heavy metal-binding domain-containing protein [Planctomycetota bacterium]